MDAENPSANAGKQLQAWILWLASFAGATLLTIVGSIQEFTWRRVEALPFDAGRLIREQALTWFAWGLIAPAVFLLGPRLDKRAIGRSRVTLLWGVLAFALTAVHTLLEVTVARAVHHVPTTMSFSTMVYARYSGTLALNIIVFTLIGLLYHAVKQHGEARAQERNQADLRAELAEAQLEVLRRQLHPHFLFNTLHSVAALMTENVDGARRVLSRLGDLLRLSLAHAESNETRVADELLFLDHYLEIQRVRFPDRLTVGIDVDPGTEDALVPSLLLQPLVENAIRHAVEPTTRPGMIQITVALREGRVWIEVRDNGPGLREDTPNQRAGLGLANTRARLTRLYGDSHCFELRNEPGKGLTVAVGIPFHLASHTGGPGR